MWVVSVGIKSFNTDIQGQYRINERRISLILTVF
jgi:hypothetical protein